MKPIIKCEICRDRNSPKDKTPCSKCISNKLYAEHFHEDKIVSICREAWDIHDDILVVNLEQKETES